MTTTPMTAAAPPAAPLVAEEHAEPTAADLIVESATPDAAETRPTANV